jgi:hypothetical protein
MRVTSHNIFQKHKHKHDNIITSFSLHNKEHTCFYAVWKTSAGLRNVRFTNLHTKWTHDRKVTINQLFVSSHPAYFISRSTLRILMKFNTLLDTLTFLHSLCITQIELYQIFQTRQGWDMAHYIKNRSHQDLKLLCYIFSMFQIFNEIQRKRISVSLQRLATMWLPLQQLLCMYNKWKSRHNRHTKSQKREIQYMYFIGVGL